MASSTPSTGRRRLGIGAGIVLAAALMGVTGVSAGAAGTPRQPGWQAGLHARSAGLNARYGLGDHAIGALRSHRAGDAPGASGSDWQQEVELRDIALERAQQGAYAIATP